MLLFHQWKFKGWKGLKVVGIQLWYSRALLAFIQILLFIQASFFVCSLAKKHDFSIALLYYFPILKYNNYFVIVCMIMYKFNHVILICHFTKGDHLAKVKSN